MFHIPPITVNHSNKRAIGLSSTFIERRCIENCFNPLNTRRINCRRRIRTAVSMDMSHVRFRFSILLCTCLEEPFQHVHLLTTRGSHYITDKQYVFGTRLYIPTHCSVLFLPPNFQSPNNRKGWIRTIKT